MDKEQRDLKVFGYGLAVLLGIIAWRLIVKHVVGFWPSILGLTGIVLAAMTAIDYRFLKPLYEHWMKVARVIGMVVSTVVLSGIFFAVFGLVGIVLRLLRKDLLSRKIEPDKESYWIRRERMEFKKERYTQQF